MFLARQKHKDVKAYLNTFCFFWSSFRHNSSVSLLLSYLTIAAPLVRTSNLCHIIPEPIILLQAKICSDRIQDPGFHHQRTCYPSHPSRSVCQLFTTSSEYSCTNHVYTLKTFYFTRTNDHFQTRATTTFFFKLKISCPQWIQVIILKEFWAHQLPPNHSQ